MNKKPSLPKRKAADYPDETTGSKMAAEIRKQANSMTAEQRAEYFKRGMVLIYGGEWPKEANRPGH